MQRGKEFSAKQGWRRCRVIRKHEYQHVDGGQAPTRKGNSERRCRRGTRRERGRGRRTNKGGGHNKGFISGGGLIEEMGEARGEKERNSAMRTVFEKEGNKRKGGPQGGSRG